MARPDSEQTPQPPAQGVQYGHGNVQYNYFAPVTWNLFAAGPERLRDVRFDPAMLENELDLAHFTGRKRLISQIEDFIGSKRCGYVVIRAEAGVGKSSLAAHLVWTRPWLHHFTLLPGGRSPEAARKSLAAQLISRWGLAGDWAPDGVLPAPAFRPEWFDRVLHAAARRRDEVEPSVPIVMVLDGLDEISADVEGDTGTPLGLPPRLPNGVFVITTSRFGFDRILYGVRRPAEWLEIEVEGDANLADIRQFIQNLTDPVSGDLRLIQALATEKVDLTWFRQSLADHCGGIWIYLRYVLDEIRDGSRRAFEIDRLPGDLAGYYASQLERWRGSPADLVTQAQWEQVRLPLLGILAAARAPLSVEELTAVADISSESATRTFVEETVRAFLTRFYGKSGELRYALRHQSLRDLLRGSCPEGRPDLEDLAELFGTQARLADETFVTALDPRSSSGQRWWNDAGSYASHHLAAHAAACDRLDSLLCDPSFLIKIRPETVLAHRAEVRTLDGRRAFAAFELSSNGWTVGSATARVESLAANAARVRAAPLVEACSQLVGAEWPISWAGWSGQSQQILDGHSSYVVAVAIGRADDRDVIVSGSLDSTVRIWDAVTGQPIGNPLSLHNGPVQTVAIGRAGDRDVIVSGSTDSTVRIWDATTGQPIGDPLSGHDGEVKAVAIGRAGDRDVIVSGSADSTVRIWDAITGEPVGRLLTDNSWVRAVAIGRAGRRDVIVSSSSNVRIWDAVTGKPIGRPLDKHDNWVEGVAIGRVGKREVIISGSSDCTVRIWDAVTAKQIGGPLKVQSWVDAVAIGRVGDRDIVISMQPDRTVRIWDAATREPFGERLVGQEHRISALAFGRAGSRDVIVFGSHDNKVRIWDFATRGRIDERPVGHSDHVNAVTNGRAGSRDVIVTCSSDHTIRIWDAATGASVTGPVAIEDDYVTSVAIGSAGGRDVIVAGLGGGTVGIWDAINGKPVGHTAPGHKHWVTSVAIGQAGSRDVVISGSPDETIRIWDAITGKPIGRPLTGHQDWVTSVAIGRIEGRDVIVSGSHDYAIRIWDAITGEPIGHPLRGHQGWVNSVAIGRSGSLFVIVSGSSDGTIRIWDPATGQPVGGPLTGHQDRVKAVAIGRAGSRDLIVSGSSDSTVRIWDAVSGKPIGPVLTGHQGDVNGVAIGRVGNRDFIASVGDDHTVLVRQHPTR